MHTFKIQFYQQNFPLKKTRRNWDFQQMQFYQIEFIIGKIEKCKIFFDLIYISHRNSFLKNIKLQIAVASLTFKGAINCLGKDKA